MTRDELVRELEKLRARLEDQEPPGEMARPREYGDGYEDACDEIAGELGAIIAKAKDGRSCDTCRYGNIVRKPGARFMVCTNLQCPGPKAARMSQYACWEAKEAS